MTIRLCLLCGRTLPTNEHKNFKRCRGCNGKWDRLKAKLSGQAFAISDVKRAIQDGILPPITAKTKCVDCGNAATDYDHRDYSKTLDVDPVCRSCNRKRGPAIWAGQESIFDSHHTAFLYQVLVLIWRGPQQINPGYKERRFLNQIFQELPHDPNHAETSIRRL